MFSVAAQRGSVNAESGGMPRSNPNTVNGNLFGIRIKAGERIPSIVSLTRIAERLFNESRPRFRKLLGGGLDPRKPYLNRTGINSV
jgi:hypothetical protein